MDILGDYFNGKFSAPHNSDEEIKKYCPGDLNNFLWTAKVDYSHIPKVIESAVKGFKTWKYVSISDRINYLTKYKNEVLKRTDEIGHLIALETGKPLWEALTEASAIAAKVDVTINDSLIRIQNQTIENVLPNIKGHIIYKPLGPSLVIGPFNFPCHLANGQILAALLAGNSIIFKPSEKTICSSQVLIECFHAAGFPDGVINFINGTGKTASDLCKASEIKAVYFTGSYAVGQKILDVTYKDLSKLVALELGGKNTTIIHQDANLDHALPELLRACFLSSGQRCTSTSTIVVHEKIEHEFINRFSELVNRIIVDHPVDYNIEPFMGPLVDEHAVKAYNNYCGLCLSEGAKEVVGLKEIKLKYKGHYVSPTVHYIDSIKTNTEFAKTEIFGPNVCITPYSDFDQAINIANISDYGLAASLFTHDQNLYHKFLNEVDAGILNLNRSTVGASSRLPFGGLKNSGNHHPAAVSMIDHCAHLVSSLETSDVSSTLDSVKGLVKR